MITAYKRGQASNPQSAVFLPPNPKCVKCGESESIKNPTGRYNPLLMQLESNLTADVRRCR